MAINWNARNTLYGDQDDDDLTVLDVLDEGDDELREEDDEEYNEEENEEDDSESEDEDLHVLVQRDLDEEDATGIRKEYLVYTGDVDEDDLEDDDDEYFDDEDIMLVSDYLANELSSEESDAVERRLIDDAEFFRKVFPLLDDWVAPVVVANRGTTKGRAVSGVEMLVDRAALVHGSNGEPYVPSEAIDDVALDGAGPQGRDICVLLDYFAHDLSPREEDAVEQRLDTDDRLYSVFLQIQRAHSDAVDDRRMA